LIIQALLGQPLNLDSVKTMIVEFDISGAGNRFAKLANSQDELTVADQVILGKDRQARIVV
jgi:hypothetical protein